MVSFVTERKLKVWKCYVVCDELVSGFVTDSTMWKRFWLAL